MKLIETDSGRGCESPQVHHKHFDTECLCRACIVSTGSRVMKWTVRQCRSRQGWGDSAEEAKNVNANDEQFALAA